MSLDNLERIIFGIPFLALNSSIFIYLADYLDSLIIVVSGGAPGIFEK